MNFFKNNENKKKILNIVTFDAELHLHGKILQYIAEIGKPHFAEIFFLGCDGIFLNCLPKKNIELHRAAKVCEMCKIQQLTQKKKTKSSSQIVNIDEKDSYLPHFIQIISEIEKADWNLTECLNITYQGVELVRSILWEFIIYTRVLDLKIGTEDRDYLCSLILDAVKLIFNMQKYFSSTTNHTFVAIDGNYALNAIVREFVILNGGNFNAVMLHPIDNYGFIKISLIPNRAIWNNNFFDQIPNLSEKFSIIGIVSNLRAISRRYKGLSDRVYHNSNSELEDKIIEFISIFRETRTLFLSSSEELTANYFSFNDYPNSLDAAKSQFEVIQEIIAKSYLAPSVGFIVRAHPRQGVSQNSKRVSSEWLEIENYLAKTSIPSNVLIIEPEMKISSYWIALKTNFSYVFWSTLGLELSLLGVTTISLQPEVSFWGLNQFSEQPKNYQEAKETILKNHHYGKINTIELLHWINSNLVAKWIELPIILPGTYNMFSLKLYIIKAFNKLDATLQVFTFLIFIKRKFLHISIKKYSLGRLYFINILKLKNYGKLWVARAILKIWAWKCKKRIYIQ